MESHTLSSNHLTQVEMPNAANGHIKSQKKAHNKNSHQTLFTTFLSQYIDEIEDNLVIPLSLTHSIYTTLFIQAKYDLSSPLNLDLLIKILNADSGMSC